MTGAGGAASLFVDHNAGTPVDPRVLARFAEVEAACPGNPASAHAPGRRARAELEEARAQAAAALGVEPDEVLFCSGGTEANNAAVQGLGDPLLPVLLAMVEHPSVIEPARRRGIAEWPVDGDGRAIPGPATGPAGLCCLVHAQGEVGTIQPVVAAAGIAVKMQVPLHVDAAQSLGRLPLEEVLACSDSVSLSPHKCGGLRGSGAWIVRRRAAAGLRPLLLGGGQEGGVRPGTVSPALAAATALAIELAVRERPARATRMAAVRAAFLRALGDGDDDARWRVVTPLQDSLPNTLMLHVSAVDGRALLPALDLAGVAASAGSACSSGSPQPPAVLAAMRVPPEIARACVRFSFGIGDDVEFAERVARSTRAVITQLQKKN